MSTATERTSNAHGAMPRFTLREKQVLRRRLLAWYKSHARDLPWRRSRDPYRVWISEVMLQQTQVATVREYFLRFLDALPDVRSLAAADEQHVLRLWEGMGYYRRARQLHAAAQRIVAEHGGELPRSVNDLQQLPGIGRYTAGAIASIAFDQRAPILEANTIRLLSRLIALENSHSSAGQQALWRVASEILPHKNVAQFNQALMELGSLICTPSEPQCDKCPLSRLCAAHAAGLQHVVPRPKAPKTYTDVREAAVIVHRNGRVLMRQCAAGERWAGLWDFPRFQLSSEGPLFAAKEVIEHVRTQTGIQCASPVLVKTFKHGVTRYRITLNCYQAKFASGRICTQKQIPIRWIAPPELPELPLSTTGRKISKLVTGCMDK